ncbi:hypothetical protein J6590_084892 [Homalodisca vitripennis]|nr:hypothetical protein J6590_084892 [Homalodisca vitripennis]
MKTGCDRKRGVVSLSDDKLQTAPVSVKHSEGKMTRPPSHPQIAYPSRGSTKYSPLQYPRATNNTSSPPPDTASDNSKAGVDCRGGVVGEGVAVHMCWPRFVLLIAVCLCVEE